jgi:hypothetical protein
MAGSGDGAGFAPGRRDHTFGLLPRTACVVNATKAKKTQKIGTLKRSTAPRRGDGSHPPLPESYHGFPEISEGILRCSRAFLAKIAE